MVLPGLHDLPEHTKFAEMERRMVSHEQNLSQDALAAPVGDLRVQIHGGVSHELLQRLEVCSEGCQRLLPQRFIGLGLF